MFLLLSLAQAAAPLSLETTQVHPTAYAIHLNVDPAQEAFSGDAEISLQFEKAGRGLQLDAVGLTITEATLFQGEQSQKVKVRIKDNRAIFSWKKAVKGEARLEVHWTGKNSTLETQGIFRQKEGDDWYLFSQFEPSDARRAFPVFDQPNVKVPWQLSITAPDGLGVFSNTPIATYTDSPGPLGLTEFAPTLPLPSYLVAFAVGPFSTLDAGSAGQNHVPVRIIVPRSMASQAQWALDSTGPLLEALEAWFQIPYPYPKLDVVALPQAVGWGAMENPGLITCVAPLVAVLPEDDTPGRQ